MIGIEMHVGGRVDEQKPLPLQANYETIIFRKFIIIIKSGKLMAFVMAQVHKYLLFVFLGLMTTHPFPLCSAGLCAFAEKRLRATSGSKNIISILIGISMLVDPGQHCHGLLLYSMFLKHICFAFL